jgi:hypothetical protein
MQQAAQAVTAADTHTESMAESMAEAMAEAMAVRHSNSTHHRSSLSVTEPAAPRATIPSHASTAPSLGGCLPSDFKVLPTAVASPRQGASCRVGKDYREQG